MDLSAFSVTVAIIFLLLGGLAKGISGMGMPLVSTPVLTLLFDLQTAIALVMLATFVTDVIVIVKTPKSWGLVKHAALLIIFGMAGVVLGSYLLVNINQLLLSGILGIVILVFVVTSFFALLPAIKHYIWLDALVGIVGGTVQGASGACGPIISMYLLQMKMSRNEFLFLINCFFAFIDLMQLIMLYQLGLYKGAVAYYSLAALVPALLGLGTAFLLHKRISDHTFRLSVLVIMAISALALLYKSVGFFF